MLRKIAELLHREAVILELGSRDKEGAIRELTQPLALAGLVADTEGFVAAILRRENLESTGVGLGVAIPHARTDTVSTTVLAFGRSAAGIDFASLDGKPSHLVFLIAAPESAKRDYISTLARVSGLLRRSEVRVGLNKAKTIEEIYTVLEENDRF